MKSSIKRRAAQQRGDSKHTPGPWKVIPSPYGPQYKCVQYGKDDRYTSLEMLPADARLVAAAPDLLESLQAVLKIADRKHDAFDAAHAAIAKATGSREGE